MSAVQEPILEQEQDAMADVTLYLIKDDLPQAVVRNLYRDIEKIHGVINFLDFGAFIQIEFVNKTDTDVAREKGFIYQLNGQEHRQNFATAGRVTSYSRQLCPPNVGVGF